MDDHLLQPIIERLHAEGYEKAYEWESAFGEVDPPHTHPFETKIVLLQGELHLTFDGQTHVLKPGDEIVVPKEMSHSAESGESGCTYVVGEKE